VVIRRYDGSVEHVPLVDLPHVDRAGAFQAFLDAIGTGADADCSGRDNVGTIAFMNAMIESAETARTVTPALPHRRFTVIETPQWGQKASAYPMGRRESARKEKSLE
jgi:hypothetical protein